MAKSFEDFVQDSPRTGLGIPVKTKNPLSKTNTPPVEPPFGFKLRGWTSHLSSYCGRFSRSARLKRINCVRYRSPVMVSFGFNSS